MNTLFQIHVTDANKTEIPIGFAVPDKRLLEPTVEAINLAVSAGKERQWHDARILPVAPR